MRSAMETATDATMIANDWLDRFGRAMESGDARAIADELLPDSHWRDLLAFTWHLFTFESKERIERALSSTLASAAPTNVRIAPDVEPREVTRAGVEVIEVMFEFETSVGNCTGVARLRPDDDGSMRAWTLMTTLEEIHGHKEQLGARRPTGEEYSRTFAGPNWLDKRQRAIAFEDRDPEVLVIGGGQCGLAVAARLGQLDVDALVVEKHGRVGDNWRKRYHSLTLHNQVWVNHLPYMPFPETFPTYIPKDKLANWFESYVDAMELNVWTSTEFLSATFNDTEERWTVQLRRGDETVELRPSHVVMAVGVSGRPKQPTMPGLESFSGGIVHAADFTQGHEYTGQRVVVFGTGNSGHDIVQELHEAGAEVTMVQRGSITVSDVEPSQAVYSIYGEGLPTDVTDRLLISSPYAAQVLGYQALTRWLQVQNKDLLEGLARIGMKTDDGHDDTGFQMKYMRRGGGYYLNVGCSELLIEGKVDLLHAEDVERIVEQGLSKTDGTLVPADHLVFATGYENQTEMLRGFFGDDVADRVGTVWGWDEGHEVSNMWKRTGQPNLYFHAGSLAQSRILSKHIALLIKARQLGLIDAAVPERPDQTVPAPQLG